MKSIKSYIIKYLCLKILLSNKDDEFKIPSENKLAEKFNCTRLTSRSALILLESMGLLISHRGSRYVVTPQASRILMFPRYIDQHFTIANESNSDLKMEIFEEYGACYVASENFYIDKQVVATVSWKISKDLFHKISTDYTDSKNIVKSILNIGEFGDKIIEIICFENNKTFIKQKVYTNNDVFLFESLSWVKEISIFSKREMVIEK